MFHQSLDYSSSIGYIEFEDGKSANKWVHHNEVAKVKKAKNLDRKALESKFLGSMLGCALGDAIGELAFRYTTEDSLYHAIDEASILRYTDDTAMMIGIAQVLCQNGDLDSSSLGNRFRGNFKKEPWRGYALGPPQIFSLTEKGYSYTQAAQMLFGGKGSFGNGAAMRVAPVGLYFYDSPDLVEKVYVSAEVTHTHPLGKDGAAVLAKAIAEVINCKRDSDLSPKTFCDDLSPVAATSHFSEKIYDICNFVVTNSSRTKSAKELGTNVTAHGSVPFAIFCFLKNRNSFENCLQDAILAGGDRDTIGAMACAVSGAHLGVEKLPADWLEKLENVSYMRELAVKMAELKKGLPCK